MREGGYSSVGHVERGSEGAVGGGLSSKKPEGARGRNRSREEGERWKEACERKEHRGKERRKDSSACIFLEVSSSL